MPAQDSFTALLEQIEATLRQFYDFSNDHSCVANLISSEELEMTDTPALSQRGNVLVMNQGGEELFVGLHYGDRVIQNAVENDPFAKLDAGNLDTFCVLVEEVSHFHLIINRALSQRQVSQLELEWQGEMDKLLLSSTLLRQQHGDAHLLPLARKLFDQARIVSLGPSNRYWEATKHAAKFWYDFISYEDGHDDPYNSENLRQILRQAYLCDWQGKLECTQVKKAA